MLGLEVFTAGCAEGPQSAPQAAQSGVQEGRVGCKVDLPGMRDAYIDQPRVMVRAGERSYHIVEVTDEEFQALVGARYTKFYEAEPSLISQVQEVVGPLAEFDEAVAVAERTLGRSATGGRDHADVARWSEVDATAVAKARATRGQRANVFTAKLPFASELDDDFPADQLGLFALRPIQAGEFVGMYTGELRCSAPGELDAPPLQKHERAYGMAITQRSPSEAAAESPTMKCEVLAHQVRNELAHINHSYRPNLVPATVVIGGVMYWALFASRDIRTFEQLTFDYGWEYFHGRTPWELDNATPVPVD
jgi:hypothetical protein